MPKKGPPGKAKQAKAVDPQSALASHRPDLHRSCGEEIDQSFNSDRHYEVFWGETEENRAFEDRHASTQAYIDYMRPGCVELARVVKLTGRFYHH